MLLHYVLYYYKGKYLYNYDPESILSLGIIYPFKYGFSCYHYFFFHENDLALWLTFLSRPRLVSPKSVVA